MGNIPIPFIDEQTSLLAEESTEKAPVPRIKSKDGWVRVEDLPSMGS